MHLDASGRCLTEALDLFRAHCGPPRFQPWRAGFHLRSAGRAQDALAVMTGAWFVKDRKFR